MMERTKIEKQDIEAIIKGEKDVSSYLSLLPKEGKMACFGVRTASNPNYLLRAIYEMYEKNLNRQLAVQMMRKLYRSVGLGASGLNVFLKKMGVNLEPEKFLLFVFTLQHQQGWGAPMELVEVTPDRIVLRCKETFESDVLKDWKIPVCGVHTGWIEGVLMAVTGNTWICEERKCHAAGDDCCEFVAEKRASTWNERAEAIRAGKRSITEFIEHRPLDGSITIIEEPAIMMPRVVFTTMMGAMSKIVGEAAAGGVINYRAYQEQGTQEIEFFRKMGILDPAALVDMGLALYSQMGWFKGLTMSWNEAKKEKVLSIEKTAESDAFGQTGKVSCHCTAGLIAGMVGTAYKVRVQCREVKCRSKGDPKCEFVVRDKEESPA